MKDLLEHKELKLKMIVIAGGASRMPFVSEIAREVFTESQILVEDNPSITVARGLCIIGHIDEQVSVLIEQSRFEIYKYAYSCYEKTLDEVANIIAKDAFARVTECLNRINTDITFGGLNAMIESSIGKLLQDPYLSEIIDPLVKEMLENIVDAVVQKANDAGKGNTRCWIWIYPVLPKRGRT